LQDKEMNVERSN